MLCLVLCTTHFQSWKHNQHPYIKMLLSSRFIFKAAIFPKHWKTTVSFIQEATLVQGTMQKQLSLRVISFSTAILVYCVHDASPTHLWQKQLQPDLLQPPFSLPSLAEMRPASQTRARLGTDEYFPEVFPSEALGFFWANSQGETDSAR